MCFVLIPECRMLQNEFLFASIASFVRNGSNNRHVPMKITKTYIHVHFFENTDLQNDFHKPNKQH